MIFWGCFQLAFLRLIRKPGRIMGLIFLPILILIVGILFPANKLESPLEAGIYAPVDSSASQELMQNLMHSDHQYVIFHEASEQEIYDNVASGRWECGFILSNNFAENYAEQTPGHLATIVRANSSSLSPLLTDVFSAALFHLRAPKIAVAYAEQSQLATGKALDSIRKAIRNGVSNQMQLSVQTIQGTASHTPNLGAATAASVCRGLCAVTLFLYALMLAADLNASKTESWFIRFSAVSGKFSLLFSMTLAQILLMLLFSSAALLLNTHFFSNISSFSFPALLLYFVFLTGLALTFGQLPASSSWLPALLPFLPAICLVLCPIFFDAGHFFPPAAPISSMLPPTWLLRAFDSGNMKVLWIASIASAFSAFFCLFLHQKS